MKVSAVSVNGAHNKPAGDPNSADGEVVLDIEVAGAVAPQAKIAVYFAPNTDQGFLNAINAAIHDRSRKPSVISISWGGAEDQWTRQSLDVYNQAFHDAALLGITVFCAAGDNGSSDGVADGKPHVDFPASSPWVVGCGGTSLQATGSPTPTETVWNNSTGSSATGGGVSTFFPLPDYQSTANVPISTVRAKFAGRGVPDISGCADPKTGYRVFVDGTESVIGGTSAVAPLWAGLTALLNEQTGLSRRIYEPSAVRHVFSIQSAERDRQRDERRLHGKTWLGCLHWPRLAERSGHPRCLKQLHRQKLDAAARNTLEYAPASVQACASGLCS